MFALTVSNGRARLLGLIICTSSTVVSSTWILGRDGESCLFACSNISQVCTEAELMLRNGDVNSESAMSTVVESQLGNCTKYNTKYRRSSDVPVYQPSSGECYVSAADRDMGSFSCPRAPPVGKHRLCWCHNSSSQVGSAEVLLNDESESGLSNQVVVFLISSAMLVVGLVGMTVAIVRRLRRRSQGIPEKVQERHPDTGFWVRCPNCGCPIGESRSMKSWAPADVDASEKSTHTKASVNSNRTNSPPYTNCPACGCQLGFPLTLSRVDGSRTLNLAEVSQGTPKYDVTVSRSFRPGGFFLDPRDLEEGSAGSHSMGNVKMGDCQSPVFKVTSPKSSYVIKVTSPKSALRKSAPA